MENNQNIEVTQIELQKSLNSLNSEELKSLLLSLDNNSLLAVKETAKEVKSLASIEREKASQEQEKAIQLLEASGIDISLLNIKTASKGGGGGAHNETTIEVLFNDGSQLSYGNKTEFVKEYFESEIENFEVSLNTDKLLKQRNTRFYNAFTSDKALRRNLMKLDLALFDIKQIVLTVNKQETVYK